MGMNLFSINFLAVRANIKSFFMGYKTILVEKILNKVLDQRLKEKSTSEKII